MAATPSATGLVRATYAQHRWSRTVASRTPYSILLQLRGTPTTPTTTVALSASLRGPPTTTTAPHTWRSGRLRVVVLCFHLLLSPSSFSRPPNVTVSEVATRPNRRLSSSSSSSNCEQRAGRKCRHRGVRRVNAVCHYVGGAYNLLRMARLCLKSAAPPLLAVGA